MPDQSHTDEGSSGSWLQVVESKRGPLWLALRINIVGFGLTALWTTLNTLVLPGRVDALVPSALRGSGVGLITFVGVGLAAVVQPIAGWASDHAPFNDRRKPFISWGSAIGVAAVVAFGWSPTFFLLLLTYVLLQLTTNVVQAAFQALIPDLVEGSDRGLASGIKNGLTVLGSAIGLGAARLLFGPDASALPIVVLLGVILGGTALLNHWWTPRVEPMPEEKRIGSLGDLLQLRKLWTAFADVLREHRRFRLAVAAQFLFMLGAYSIQRFGLYFLENRFGSDTTMATASIGLALAIVLAALAALAAGALSDTFGRATILRWSIVLTAVGLIGIGIFPSLVAIGATGAAIAMGVGAFQAVNWALLSDEIPEGQGARFFGIANIATAGAGALAGLFGPLVDVLEAILPAGSYAVTFGVAGLITATSLLPILRLARDSEDD